jgi:purine-binding chemotaxis protein CheW
MNDFLELIPEFLDEARDHITSIEADLVQIETALTDRRSADPETLQRLFRSAHAIKGGSEFVGLETIEEIALALETLFNFMRNGDITPDVELVTAALAAIDRIKTIAVDPTLLAPGEMEGSATAIRDLTDARLADRTRRSAATVLPTADLFDGIGFTVSEYTIERKARRGNFFAITIDIDRYTKDTGKTVIDLSALLGSFGEILDTVTAAGDGEQHIVHFLYHTMLEEEALRLSLPFIAPEHFRKIPRERLEKLSGGRRTTAPQAERRAARTAPPAAPNAEPAEKKTVTAPAEPVAETPPDPTGTSLDPAWELCTEFVTFFMEHEQYAVPIFLVHDIKEMLPFSLLPNQPSSVLGVVNLRGNVVPVFDLRRILGLPARPFDRKTVILILNIGGKITGCVVDAISDVVTLEHQDKQSTPLLGRDITADYVRFIGKDKKSGTFLIVLDIEKMLPG